MTSTEHASSQLRRECVRRYRGAVVGRGEGDHLC
jgi:hypothetical protein